MRGSKNEQVREIRKGNNMMRNEQREVSGDSRLQHPRCCCGAFCPCDDCRGAVCVLAAVVVSE